MTLPAPPAQTRSSNPLVRALRAPFEARTWKETLHLLLNMPFGIATFTIIVTGFALGFGLLITLIGIPILIAMLYVSRAMGTVERVRAGLLLDVDVPSPYRADPPKDMWWRPFTSRASDPATWMRLRRSRAGFRRLGVGGTLSLGTSTLPARPARFSVSKATRGRNPRWRTR